MSISQNFPSTRPSLNLNFARSKTLDPRITFTRTSSATYVDEDGLIKTAPANAPRFDHDPVTGECLGLLIEESRSNLVTDSITLDNFPDKTNITVQDNAIISPDGTQNAGKIIETIDTGSHSLSRLNVSTLQNNTYTISGYFKGDERKYVQISFRNVTFWGTPGGPSAVFNLETGTLDYTTGVVSNPTITSMGNGWYRCSVSATRDGSGTITSGIAIGILNDTPTTSYQGVEGYGIYAWGLQFESGAFSTSYIPTSGSTVTRTKEYPTISGTDFTNFYNPSEGTFYVRYNIKGSFATDGFNRIFEISDGGSTNRFFALLQGINDDIYESGTLGINFNTSLITFGDFYTYIVGYKENDFQRYAIDRNGNIDSNTDTSVAVSSFIPTELNIGYEAVNDNRQLNGHISQFIYYPARLSNSQLQTLLQQ